MSREVRTPVAAVAAAGLGPDLGTEVAEEQLMPGTRVEPLLPQLPAGAARHRVAGKCNCPEQVWETRMSHLRGVGVGREDE